MNTRSELIWWIGSGLLGTFIIAIITGFKFGTLDLQFHDTYYVLDSVDAIMLLIYIFAVGRYAYLLTDIMTERYPILTLLVSIMNAIVALFVLIAAYFSIETIVTFRKMYPGNDFSSQLLLPGIFIGLLTVQAIVEVKMLGKLRALLAAK